MKCRPYLLFAAAIASAAPAFAAAQFANVVWYLKSIRPAGAAAVTIPVASRDSYYAAFQANGAVAVEADCNKCTGSFDTSGANLTVSGLSCTRMYCGPASYDTRFVDALTTAASYSLPNDSTLRVLCNNGADTLFFVRMEASGTRTGGVTGRGSPAARMGPVVAAAGRVKTASLAGTGPRGRAVDIRGRSAEALRVP